MTNFADWAERSRLATNFRLIWHSKSQSFWGDIFQLQSKVDFPVTISNNSILHPKVQSSCYTRVSRCYDWHFYQTVGDGLSENSYLYLVMYLFVIIYFRCSLQFPILTFLFSLRSRLTWRYIIVT